MVMVYCRAQQTCFTRFLNCTTVLIVQGHFAKRVSSRNKQTLCGVLRTILLIRHADNGTSSRACHLIIINRLLLSIVVRLLAFALNSPYALPERCGRILALMVSRSCSCSSLDQLTRRSLMNLCSLSLLLGCHCLLSVVNQTS